jgi:hypothetical protein
MKVRSRVLLLAGAFILGSVAIVDARSWQTDTCYISCDGAQYTTPATSVWQCCTTAYRCPDNSAPFATVWSGGAGEFPTFCGPYAD